MTKPLLWIAGLIIVAVVIYVVIAGVRMYRLIQISKTLVAKSDPYTQHGTGPRILVIGDSTGVGTGVTDSKGSIAGRFAQNFPNAIIENLSVNGWKVADALRHFPNVEAQTYDLIVLQIGANDIIQRTPMADFTRDLSALFVQAKSAGKNVVALHSGNIGLAPLFPWPISRYLTTKTRQYRAEYMRIAKDTGVTYVDLYGEASTDLFLTDIPRYYAPDLLHLTEDGYGFWYGKIREAMQAAGISL